ncbi:hypothetical protein PI172_0352 [Prevotella intermedia]|uniref:Uncharacterized protein n=1 Tax=Prevotella intermedia TaxID=28131 RepID=A0AAD1BGT3_PREIN|nr:hypothetical protein PI172_0352 [Prevotella intermedia]
MAAKPATKKNFLKFIVFISKNYLPRYKRWAKIKYYRQN